MAQNPLGWTLLACATLTIVGCSNRDVSPDVCERPARAVPGAADAHCGSTVGTVNPNACAPSDGSGGLDAGTGGAAGGGALGGNGGTGTGTGLGSPDAGTGGTGGGGAGSGAAAGADAGNGSSSFGAILPGNEGDTVDCKYHVTWSISQDCAQGASLTVGIRSKASGAPVLGASPEIELLLDQNHPAPGLSAIKTEELGSGFYLLSPILFDQSGTWTLHLTAFPKLCAAPSSPRSEIAFQLEVP